MAPRQPKSSDQESEIRAQVSGSRGRNSKVGVSAFHLYQAFPVSNPPISASSPITL
jgi:hypothetical protein